jgi:hypothetical protein
MSSASFVLVQMAALQAIQRQCPSSLVLRLAIAAGRRTSTSAAAPMHAIAGIVVVSFGFVARCRAILLNQTHLCCHAFTGPPLLVQNRRLDSQTAE